MLQSPIVGNEQTPFIAKPDSVSVKEPGKRQKLDAIRPKLQTAAKQTLAKPQTSTAAVKSKAAEIKTDFIALSYARGAESGQIVRVKVPSSMMVTLGLVATVEKPTSLVDAEVVIGDDGLTRAIRFIH